METYLALRTVTRMSNDEYITPATCSSSAGKKKPNTISSKQTKLLKETANTNKRKNLLHAIGSYFQQPTVHFYHILCLKPLWGQSRGVFTFKSFLIAELLYSVLMRCAISIARAGSQPGRVRTMT